MIDEKAFKITLIKYLQEIELKKDANTAAKGIPDLLSKCEIYFEYTSIFTRKEWDTYCAVLHIKAPINIIAKIEKWQRLILEAASSIFGRQDDYLLTHLSIDPLIEKHEVIDFSEFGQSATLMRAVAEAEELMRNGKYSSAIDRIHTTLMGYLRLRLNDISESYNEGDTIMQLYSKLHNRLPSNRSAEMNDLIRTSIRSASGVVDAINNIRNKHSLAHPNEDLVEENEAKLVIGLCKAIFSYLESNK